MIVSDENKYNFLPKECGHARVESVGDVMKTWRHIVLT